MDQFFAAIEGTAFRNQAVVINSLAGFTAYLEGIHGYRTALHAYGSYPQEGAQLLKERILKLFVIDYDSSYAHPYDASIAAYLYLLYKLNPSAFESMTQDMVFPNTTWWSKQMLIVISGLMSDDTTAYTEKDFSSNTPTGTPNVQFVGRGSETNDIRILSL